VVSEVHGEPTKFDFEPLDHITLMKNHDMVDIDRGVKLG
jgi:seryl-tRNA synthetase